MDLIERDKVLLTKDERMLGYVDTNLALKLQLCKIAEAPAVEAIPVEWIKRWANDNCMYCYDYDYPTEKHDSWYAIRDMIEEWGKENGNQNL